MNDLTEIKGIQNPREVEITPHKLKTRIPDPQYSFADMLSNAVNTVDQTMKASEQSVQDFASGKTDNVHDVMINLQQAQISFQMMVEIRNKAIEAYQEISRMQI
ncbi:MAG: flagellar hook-basal body complex protein FliE [Balneolales bacterium]